MALDEAYQIAEQKIEEALRSGATELDLSGGWGKKEATLTKLPESLSQLTQLRALILSGNQLTKLPEWLGQLTQLQSLHISINRLTELPEWLGQLTQLRELSAANNLLESLPESLGRLKYLEELYLPSNNFAEFPASIRDVVSLRRLYLMGNELRAIPDWIGELQLLDHLNVQANRLSSLPAALGTLQNLKGLILGWAMGGNPLGELPPGIRNLKGLEKLYANNCQLLSVPEWIGELTQLREVSLDKNNITDLPLPMAQLEHLESLALSDNPLNPELAAAYKESIEAVRRYLRAKAGVQVVLNEAKLILVGEGEVGKSCLLGALRGDPWEEGRPTTHGIEIKPVKAVDPGSGVEITLNGWDFGGQPVYRPTHQLFFSAPAVYLVVWKPREGPQQGFVKDWIKLVKHREPEAKILVVATHGGPKERQPDIDRQEIWDLFGKEMVLDFKWVESKPDDVTEQRHGIEDLKETIAQVAASLPEVGRTVPKSWDDARKALKESKAAYMPLQEVLKVCQGFGMDEEMAKDFVRVSRRLGHLIHYEHDPALHDIVILKPDWLATAISLVLDDKQTRDAHGLVEFSHLRQLWNDPARPDEYRYDDNLHPLFLRLMERFDLSYKVSIPSEPEDAIGFWQRVSSILSAGKNVSEELSKLHYTSLIAQLVPDIRPDPIPGWTEHPASGDEQQSQICRIVEVNTGHTAPAEGLFFRLIVRLHKYSLGRFNYAESAHWQRGLVLEDDYGARALLEHVGNDVRITVRSPYPERFLSALTYEVQWLVESFWAGLRCDIMVPCLNQEPCKGLFEVGKLIENKKRSRPEQPCPVCNEWQSIGLLLHNAPAAHPNPLDELLANSEEVMTLLAEMRLQSSEQHAESLGRFDSVDAAIKEVASKVEASYANLMQTLTDEAKEGPRLFSFEPVEPGFFDRPRWISQKFRITLWCEHSRLPLPALNGKDDKRGVYEPTLPREWIVKAAPFLKILASTLSLVMPVAASATKLLLDETAYKGIEKQLELGQKSADSILKGGAEVGGWLGRDDALDLEQGDAIRARGAVLRQLHAWLKDEDASFGGLIRVQNKRQEFLWVHPQFEKEY